MKYIAIFLMFLFSIGLNAQDKLSDKLREDFESIDWLYIESVISDKNSVDYYPMLYSRYLIGDSTLTVDDYRLLYYGYSFQESYAPLENESLVRSVLRYHSQILKTQSSEELYTLLEMTKGVLDIEPFNIRILNLMTFCYIQLNDVEGFTNYSRKMNGIVDAILSSGSGVDKNSPWSVIYRDDIVDLTVLLGGEVSIKTYITTNIEYFHLNKRIEDIRGFYFDLTAILNYVSKYGKKEKKGFEFNPKYNPKSNSYINRKIGK